MTADQDRMAVERLVAGWLEDAGPADIRPGAIASALARAGTTRQRGVVARAVRGPSAWPPGRVSTVLRPVRPMLRAALVLAVVAALLAGTLLVGSRTLRPPDIEGVLEPLGMLPMPLFAPAAARLGDGTVLVVGIDPTAMRVGATVVDPDTGVKERVDATDLGPARHTVSVVALPDGDALVVVQAYSSIDGSRGDGGAWRYDPGSRRFARTGRVAQGNPSEVRDFHFAAWPVDRLADGRFRWVAPAISAEHDVVYDPTRDVFEPAVAAGVQDPRPVDGDSLVGLADGRILDLRGTDDDGNAIPIRLIDRASAAAPISSPALDWPEYSSGSAYRGAMSSDGRVLIVGPTLALFDPRTLTFKHVDDPVPPQSFAEVYGSGNFRPCQSLPDGRLILSYEVVRGSALWLFDPATDDWRELSHSKLPGTVACSPLDADRVIVVTSDDGSATGSLAPSQAWLLR